jgi:hypothetical protein
MKINKAPGVFCSGLYASRLITDTDQELSKLVPAAVRVIVRSEKCIK